MSLLALDLWGHPASPIHRLDARVKLLGTLALILTCASTPPTAVGAFAAYLALLLALALAARLPLGRLLRRSLVVVPFVLAVGAFIPFQHFAHPQQSLAGGISLGLGGLKLERPGLLLFWNIAIKAWTGVLTLSLLTATTGLPALLGAMERLGAPRLLVMMAGFTYRYLFVLADEAQRMRRAAAARGFRARTLAGARPIGQLIATLYLRSYERGERVYQAMLARGFDAAATPPASGPGRLTGRDCAALAALAAVLLLVRGVAR